MSLLPIYQAPLQGYTEAPYRTAHARFFGGVTTYFAPFVRIERGEIRSKDLRELKPENNEGIPLIPQLLAADAEELKQLLETVLSMGYREVDLNMGCPFPMLVKHGKGAGIMARPQQVKELLEEIRHYPDVRFSVKMRLGMNTVEEGRASLPLFNEAPLQHVTLHPRLGIQQFKGEVDEEAFLFFYNGLQHPLIYNGDITTTARLQQLAERYPRLKGLMVGRGLLANPALAIEYQQGISLSRTDFLQRLGAMHQQLFNHYSSVLQGDTQLMSKMLPFWEYLAPQFEKKGYKKIRKSTKPDSYLRAVAEALAL